MTLQPNWKLLLGAVIAGIFWTGEVFACSRAMHDWELKFHATIPLSAPILPFNLLETLRNRVSAPTSTGVSEVYWVAEHNALSRLVTFLLNAGWFQQFLPDDSVPVTWKAQAPTSSVLQMARKRMQETAAAPPLILGTDRHSLRLALFTDRNSMNTCHQLVLFESARLRAVQPHPTNPWAQETSYQGWIAFIFSRSPAPAGLLAIYIFPHNHASFPLHANPAFVLNLLEKHFLKWRPLDEEESPHHIIPEFPHARE